MELYGLKEFVAVYGVHHAHLRHYSTKRLSSKTRALQHKLKEGGNEPKAIFYLTFQMIQEIIHHDIHQHGDPKPLKSLFNLPFRNRDGVGHGSVKLTLKYKRGNLTAVGVGLARDDYKRMAWFFEKNWGGWLMGEFNQASPASGFGRVSMYFIFFYYAFSIYLLLMQTLLVFIM